MPNEKITAMPTAGAVDGTEPLPLVQSGTNKQIAINALFGAYSISTDFSGNIILDAPTINLSNASPTIIGGDASGSGLYITSNFSGNDSGQIGLQTNDTVGSTGTSGAAYLGTGSGGSSSGDSGAIGFYTGGATGGNTGDIDVTTGNASDTSGHIRLATGSGGGTRGNIILDAALIQTPNATGSNNSDTLHFTSGTTVDGDSGDAGFESGGVSGSGTSGTGFLGSSDSTGGATGDLWIYTGAAGGGDSGTLHLQTGTATGTRGNIILDGPMVKRGVGEWYADPGVGFDIECSNEGDLGDASTAAAGVYLQAAYVNTLGKGGTVFIQAGDGGSTGGDGGLMGIQAGGSNFAGASGGAVEIVGGFANVSNAIGGKVEIQSGQGAGNGASGLIQIHSGVADNLTGTSGDVNIWSGTGATSGNINITTEVAFAGNSGNIHLETGAVISGTRGSIILAAPLVHHPAGFFIQCVSDFNAGTDDATGSTASAGTFLYSGNTETGRSGNIDFYTGDGATTGDSILETGNASAGDSGSVTLRTGTATGTRGNIILDADLIASPVGSNLEIGTQSALNTDFVALVSGDSTGDGNTGWLSVGTGSSAGGTSGTTTIYSGSSDSGQSGDVQIVPGRGDTAALSGILLLEVCNKLVVQLDNFLDRTAYFIISNLPTSSSGLPSGAVWRDAANGNVLKMVP